MPLQGLINGRIFLTEMLYCACIYAVCWNRETSSPPVSGAAGGSAVVEDSRSESEDTRRSEPKNEPASSPGILSLLPADLPLRRGPSSVVLDQDDRSEVSSESPTNRRPASPSDHRCEYSYLLRIVFTALHVMQTRYCDENSVCLSVCLSVCHTRVLSQNGRKICPDLYTIRKNI